MLMQRCASLADRTLQQQRHSRNTITLVEALERALVVEAAQHFGLPTPLFEVPDASVWRTDAEPAHVDFDTHDDGVLALAISQALAPTSSREKRYPRTSFRVFMVSTTRHCAAPA